MVETEKGGRRTEYGIPGIDGHYKYSKLPVKYSDLPPQTGHPCLKKIILSFYDQGSVYL